MSKGSPFGEFVCYGDVPSYDLGLRVAIETCY